jgi:hypothetical protein
MIGNNASRLHGARKIRAYNERRNIFLEFVRKFFCLHPSRIIQENIGSSLYAPFFIPIGFAMPCQNYFHRILLFCSFFKF